MVVINDDLHQIGIGPLVGLVDGLGEVLIFEVDVIVSQDIIIEWHLWNWLGSALPHDVDVLASSEDNLGMFLQKAWDLKFELSFERPYLILPQSEPLVPVVILELNFQIFPLYALLFDDHEFLIHIVNDTFVNPFG